MNTSQTTSLQESKCSCIKNFFSKILNKKTPKKNKKTDSEINSELNYILTKKKGYLQINNPQNTISPPSKIISSNRINSLSKSRIKNTMTGTGISKIKKPPVEKKKFFHEFKDKLRCFFCGGRGCKHENYKNNILNNNAIEGLHSNYITENIIASQRPCEILIDKYKLISKFKELNISLIVNLQREGEHPFCGPNAYHLTSAGYSYNPSVFSGDDIKIKLSGWKDMEVPSSMNFMLDIVKEMSIVTIDKKGKCLVHCHAGYGRTGVVIVCYLLFVSLDNSDVVIKKVRSKRKKCVETNSQVKYCKKFEEFLNHSRIIFGDKVSIDVYLKRQEDLLFGDELKKYGFIPKLIVKVLEKITFLKKKYNLDCLMIYKLFQGILIDWNDELENILCAMKTMINKSNWKLFEETENLILIIELLFDWFEDCVEYVISLERTEIIINSIIYNEYVNEKYTFAGKYNMNNNKRKEFFDFIKKEYHCFEYEILFYFASFLTNFTPNGNDEENNFDKMIERISLELLGLSFSEKTINQKYNELTFPLINGLSTIIKLIYYSLKINECENDNNDTSFCVVCPKRKNIPIEFSYSNEIKNLPNTEKPIPKKRKSMFITSNFHFLKGSGISKYSETSSIPIKRQTTGNVGKLLNGNFLLKDEAKLKQIYNVLNQHFSSKQNIFLDENKSHFTNEGISCFSVDSLTPDKTSTKKSKQIDEVIEEILNKNSNSSSYSSSIDNNSVNSKKSLKKNIFKSDFSPILLKTPIKEETEVSKNNFIIEEDKKENDNNEKDNSILRSKSLYGNNKNNNNDKNMRLRKSIVEELKLFNNRNSDLGNKIRKKGLDMTQCKNKSDKALIDLMKFMNNAQKNLKEELGMK